MVADYVAPYGQGLLQLAHMPVRGGSKHPLVFPVELRRAFIPHGQSRKGGIFIFHQHQALSFIQAQTLPKLQGAEGRYLPEVPVEGGSRHIDLPG